MSINRDKQSRSYNMSKIRCNNTKPENIVRKFLFSKGLRYRKNDKRYPGRPDIVLPKYRAIIFVNGCFWHSHEGCSKYVVPKTNSDYWIPKLKRNRERDEENINELKNSGWNVIIVWECELGKPYQEVRLERLYSQIVTALDL